MPRTAATLAAFLALSASALAAAASPISVGPRPYALIDAMEESPLKTRLLACADKPVRRTLFSIGHRGAALQFPEHTAQSYRAAARMGAGIVECDATFTRDKVLVCRHSQNDLHRTTNILTTPLADRCAAPFRPASGARKAAATCRTTDLTAAEFLSLRGKMDSENPGATTPEDYQGGLPSWRTDLYDGAGADLVTHAQSIALLADLGVKFTPELKSPVVEMPYDGFAREDYAQALIDEYKAAGVAPADVWPQSFRLEDVLYWIEAEPEFGAQAVFLDGRYRKGLNPADPATFRPSMADLKSRGVNYIAPPLWMLLTVEDGAFAASAYAREARAAGLRIIAWTVERSGSLADGGGWYHQTIRDALKGDGSVYPVLHALATEVGVVGVFSDWPGTVSYYASCMGLD